MPGACGAEPPAAEVGEGAVAAQLVEDPVDAAGEIGVVVSYGDADVLLRDPGLHDLQGRGRSRVSHRMTGRA